MEGLCVALDRPWPMLFIFIIYIPREQLNDTDEALAPTELPGGVPRKWVVRSVSKRVPGGGRRGRPKARDLCLWSLRREEWLQVAGV